MASRMDKYEKNQIPPVSSRTGKNSLLYEEVNNNKTYTEFSDVKNNAVDLTGSLDNPIARKREEYQKRRIFEEKKPTVSLNDYNNEFLELKEEDVKIYDINSVMEAAKKNRSEADELEKKRKLKNIEYDILSDLSQEKLAEYREKKHDKLTKDEEENLEEIFNTITSNSMRQKIDDQLLEDLMPSEVEETVISEELAEQVTNIDTLNEEKLNKYKTEEKEIKKEVPEIDNSFYTKSMDLSEEDFISDKENDEEEFFDEKEHPSILKVIPVIVGVLIVLGVIAYILYNYI